MSENNCNGCEYSKKLKYSGWPCCGCNKCEVEVRADERKNAERDFQNSDYWNDYLTKVINDAKKDERSKIIEILDSADDSANAMYLLTKYLIEEQLKE